jgi:hypothetical protein
MLDAALSPVFVAFFSDVAQPRLHPPVIPRQEVGDIKGVILTSLTDSDKLIFFLDATAWVAVMQPTEPGATGRAAREVFDVFLVRTVFTVALAPPALGLGLSVVFLPNRDKSVSPRAVVMKKSLVIRSVAAHLGISHPRRVMFRPANMCAFSLIPESEPCQS